MTISNETAQVILKVLRKYEPDDRVLLKLFTELRKAPGSVSYHETLSKLIVMLRSKEVKLPPARKRRKHKRDDRLGSINHMPDIK